LYIRPVLPGPYERWYRELTGRAAPVETRSTCADCAMAPGAPDLPPEGPFDMAVRCCTYHPHIPAHLVGGILEAGTAEGRAIVRARIAARSGVSPLGLGPTPAFGAALQRVTARPGGFGHSREILCPFYADATCTIWQHRGVVCAAFHCKFDRGALGAGLWHLIVIAFNVIERALARWLLKRQGLDAEYSDALLRAPDDAELDARAWGAWRGREVEFFVEAARLIAPLSWAEVDAIGGRDIAGLAAALRGAVERFEAYGPPERVRRGDEILYRIAPNGNVRLQHRGVPNDLVEVSAQLADRLARLEEAPLADLGVDDATARRLLDWQVLVPVTPR
jgi:hypothetical protein